MAKQKKPRARSRRGAGTIIERTTKTLGVRFVIMHSYVDLEGRRHRPELRFSTRSQAENASAVLKSQTAGRGKLGGNGMARSLLEVSQQWMHQLEVASGTEMQREMALRTHVLPYLGRHRMLEMTPDLLDRWKNLLLDSGVGPSACRTAWGTLRICLQYAVDLRILSTHPMHGLRAPKKQPKEIVPFTEQEVQRIFAAAQGLRELPMYQLLYSLGIRQGELLGLKWADLDLEQSTLTIRRQALDEGGQLVIKEATKTKAGMRTLGLSEEHLAIFAARRLQAEDEGLWPVGWPDDPDRLRPDTVEIRGRERPVIDCEWVFPVTRGQRRPMLRRNLLKTWTPFLARLGIAHRGLHHFRHTAATQMLLSGENILDIAGTLGHSKPETTMRIYSHVMDKVHGAPLKALAGRTTPQADRQAAEGRLDTSRPLDTLPTDSSAPPHQTLVGVTGFEPATSTSRR